MKLQAYKAAAFIEQPDKSLCVFLLYGPDTGLVRERGTQLAKKFVDDLNDPFAIADISADTLGSDPSRLADELATIPMLGGTRLVRIRDAGDAAFVAVDRALENPPTGKAIAILEAGDLDKRSKLRARVEDDGRAMAIPCYPEEGADLTRNIQGMLRTQGFSVEPEALDAMVGLLPPDRIGVRLEIDKLVSYALKANPKRITLDDVEAALSDGHAETVDEAIWAAASANLPKLDAALARLAAEDTPPIVLLRGMQRHLLRLYEVRAKMADGESMEEAVKGLRPAVFYKRANAMRDQARRWSLPVIHAALHLLVAAEVQSKSTGFPAERLSERALLGLGKLMAR
jgi:DNA polymerase-3 subunit delta